MSQRPRTFHYLSAHILSCQQPREPYIPNKGGRTDVVIVVVEISGTSGGRAMPFPAVVAPTAAVLVLCLTFLADVIVQSWDETLWKSSVFAYIISRPRVVVGEEFFVEELLELTATEADVFWKP